MRITIRALLAAFLPCVVLGQVWIEHSVDSEFDRASSVFAIDMDGDGDIDVLGAGDYSNTVTWWENTNGIGTVWIEHLVDGNFSVARSVFATDVDGDGDTDVLGAAENDGIAWWENEEGTGTVWTEHTVDSNVDRAITVYATDMDGDSDIDVLGAVSDDNEIAWWENVDASGTVWAKHTVDDTFNGAHCVFSADVDGDGDPDVLGAAWYDNDITWWENTDGAGSTWTEHIVENDFYLARWVYAADVDSDGDCDVLGASRGDDAITWWQNMDGDGSVWIEHTVDSDFDGANCVYAVDMDGDGNVDVLGAAIYDDDITWWKNLEGSGTSWTKYTVDSDFDAARSVYATDVNGDGNVDVLGAAVDDDDITWWEQVESYLTIELEPFGAPIEIPGPGGYFHFQARIVNWSGDLVWFSGWTEATLPNGNSIGPLLLHNYLGLPPYTGMVTVMAQGVPGFAPAGEYSYTAHLGDFPDMIMASDSFPFTKVAAGIAGQYAISDWSLTDIDSDTETFYNSPLPQTFAVEPASPNPFNATTQIKVSLPEAARLKVHVFNVTGQRVATLADGEYSAGEHVVTLDATRLASGLYFVHVAVPGQLEIVQKVMLVR